MKLLKVDTVKEVKDKLKAYFDEEGFRPPFETVGLRDAVHRYLAEEICSDTDIPQFDRSVVDGYAVIARDTFGTGESAPVFLEVIGSVDMGKACTFPLEPGKAVYVPTGGMLPVGADAVVMVEYVEHLDEKTIAIYRPAAPNSGIMNRGDDFKKEQLLFRRGHRITVKDIGMLAAIGKDRISVFKKPIVSILSTGDEIVDIAETPKPGEVRDINSYTIAAFAEATGAEIRTIQKVPDEASLLRNALSTAMAESDIVLISGGSSAGNKDMTAEIIDSMGAPGVVTHGIAMKPGKPTIIGIVENGQGRSKLVVGLPGHPMAAIVAYDVIVNDFMRKYCFHNEEDPICLTAKIAENIHAGEGRETYQLVSLKKQADAAWIAEPIHAKSGSISQLMMADGYIKISSLSEGVKADSSVEVTLIGR